MDALFSFVNQIEPWHWAALALVLLIGELMTGTTFLLWPAAAAGLVALLAWLTPLSPAWQVGVFAALTLVLTLMGPGLRRRILQPGEAGTLNERSAQLIGQRGRAEAEFADGVGRVHLGDTIWRAESADAIAGGVSVEVIGVDGTILKVKRAG